MSLNDLLASDYYLLSVPLLYVAAYLAGSAARRCLAVLLERIK